MVALLASFLALLGGAIGVASAITALRVVGSDPAYRSRVCYGWIALLCALVAPWGVLLAGRNRKNAMALTLLGGAVGAVAINLFYLNTYYVMALPCGLLGLLMAEIRSRVRRRSSAFLAGWRIIPDKRHFAVAQNGGEHISLPYGF